MPFPSPTVRRTNPVKFVAYTCCGFCWFEREPSPNSQSHETIGASPWREPSANTTERPVIVNVKEARGPWVAFCWALGGICDWMYPEGFEAIPNASAKPVRRRPTPARRSAIPKIRESVSRRFSGRNMERRGPRGPSRITVPTLVSRLRTA